MPTLTTIPARSTRPRRTALAVIATGAIAALVSCSTDNGDSPTTPPPPTNTTTTVALDPFDGDVYGWHRKTAQKIVDIGHQRHETDTAIFAVLTASYAEQRFDASVSTSGGGDLFGWLANTVPTPKNGRITFMQHQAGYVAAAINNFYQRGHDLNLTTDDPVDYAVDIQTSETRPSDLGNHTYTYWEDRQLRYDSDNYKTRDKFVDDASIRAGYNEALPYARAAYDQLG